MPPAFVCDGMLGSLARWLRLLGFDTLYAGSHLDDNDVLELCRREGRVLLTRDVALLQRARNQNQGCWDLSDGTVQSQVQSLLERAAIHLDPERFFTRCTRCNGSLGPRTKAEVASRVPAGILELHTQFWQCGACGHVYWKGTHVEEIHRKLAGFRPSSAP